jgi:hypothetical protein
VLSVALVASLLILNPASPSPSAHAASTPTEDKFIDMQPNSFLSSATAPAISLNSPLTVEAWINPDTADGIWAHLFDLSATQEFYVKLGFSGAGDTTGDLYAYVNNGGNHQPCGEVLTGRWTHIAVTYAADAVSCYVNGALSGTVSNGVVTTTPMIQLGKYRGATANDTLDFPGGIDQVKLWTRTLSIAEVNASMHSWGSPSLDLSGNPLNISSDLKHHYDFNSGSGPVEDLVGSADLSITGTATFESLVQTSQDAADVVLTFPRTYLSSQGGWIAPDGFVSASALVLGGGGGGGAWVGGGGGGGGLTSGYTTELQAGSTISVLVGQGGIGAKRAASFRLGTNGQTSRISFGSSLVALGGGVGASSDQVPGDGNSVATGGGGGPGLGGNGTQSTGGSALAIVQPHATGGGGGAGGNGLSGSESSGTYTSGNGGSGLASTISGTSVTYGGGGGGSAHGTWDGPGAWRSSVVIFAGSGVDGGGNGARVTSSSGPYFGDPGAANRGGGGGGAAGYFWPTDLDVEISEGGSGGSGVVILRYTPQNTITFEGFGTNELDPISVTTGSSVAEPADPTTSSEAIFLGWTTVLNNPSTLVTWNYTPTSDVTLYGLWKSSPGLNSEVDFALQLSSSEYATGANSLPLGSQVTWESWLKPSSDHDSDPGSYFGKEFAFVFAVTNGTFWYHAGSGEAWVGSWTNTGVPAVMDAWQHVAYVMNGTDLDFYLNGQLAKSDLTFTGGSIGTSASQEIFIGSRPANSEYFVGEIDEVRIWNTNRSASQILDSMHLRLAGNESNLQAYWDFNEPSGTTTVSSRTGQHDLTTNPNPVRVDVKQVSSAGGDTVIVFPRTYLPGVGGWTPPAGVTAAELLLVGGGGGGSGNSAVANFAGAAGSGGGGGVLRSANVGLASPSEIKVGAGGLGGRSSNTNAGASGNRGQTSAFRSLTAGGGGAGGCEAVGAYGAVCGTALTSGGDGTAAGSGGSPSNFFNAYSPGFAGTASATVMDGVTYPAVPGNKGGYFNDGGSSADNSAGSAGGAGGAGNLNTPGAGLSSTISGFPVAYGAGGASWNSPSWASASPLANRGTGGNGAYSTSAMTGFDGSAGLVVIRYTTATAPVITVQPETVLVTPGSSATLEVTATGNGTLSYQWQESTDNGSTWVNVGTDSDTYQTSALSLAESGRKYRVTVTNTINGSQSVTSNVATVTVAGVTITDGACSAMVADSTGVSISEVADGGCLVEYTETGSNTFTVPANVTAVRALIVGAGGGGGAGRPGTFFGGGGGGGGGGHNVVQFTVTASQEISLTVGEGGAGGNNSDGGNGGSSSILYGNSVSSTSVTASGGFGGKRSVNGAGVAGNGATAIGTGLGGASGGPGARRLATQISERPGFGDACPQLRSFGGSSYCVGGGGGGGNREVGNDPFFNYAAGSRAWANGTLVSGGTGGYHNQTSPVPATSGVANRGGGGGGGSYDLEQNIARSGADGADGLLAFYFVPGAGQISLSAVSPVSFSQTTIPITLTKENPTTDVTWTTSNTAVCTVTGNDTTGTVTQVAPGQCDVSVRLAASSSFGVGSANTSFRIDKINRPIAPSWSGTILSVPYGSTSNLWTKISSPGTNSYRISISGTVGGCSVAGYTLSVGDVGSTCTVDLFHSGDEIYLERQATNQLSVTITKISQSPLILTSGTAMSVNQTFQLSAAGGTGPGALTYHVADDGSTGCTISNPSSGVISGATAAGNCTVYAKRAASTNSDQVTSSNVVITVSKVNQVLQWVSQPQAQYVAGNTYALEATASSQLAVSYTISAGLCSLAGTTVTFTGSGDCVIQAFQTGSPGVNAAVTISQTVAVGKINQTMTFSAIANQNWGSLAFSLSATVSSGLTISYSENNQTTNDACDVTANGVVTIKNVGTCAITATQAGDAANTSVTKTQVFEVTANQAGAPFIGSISFGDRSLTAGFFAPSYLGGGNISAYQLTAYNLDGTVAATNSGCIANPGPTQSCTVFGLVNGDIYYLRVAAITQAGLGVISASTSMIVPASNPEAVGSLIAIEGNGTLTLNWTKPTSFGGGNFFQYRIYWRAPGESYQPDGAPGHTIGFENSTSHVITGLRNGVAYDVKIITATSNNNLELQSNTAEVNQTPYTVPDAPASVVALDNGSTVVIAWQPPTFDGGNPIDQYEVKKGSVTVCTITSVSTTSCEVAKPEPGTSNIEVRAGNDAGLSLPAQTTFVVQSVAGSNQVVAGSGGISLPGVTPNIPRPVVTDVSGSAVVSVNDLVRLVGTNMRLVNKVLVGDVEASFFVNSDGLITIRVPVGVPAGKVVITLIGVYGSVFFTDLFEIKTSLQSVDQRATIGTFLGFAAVYTKNHEGKRLSMRIGSKWRVIDPLSANYTYNFTKVGVGRTVTVMVYLDRKLVKVQQIKIQ